MVVGVQCRRSNANEPVPHGVVGRLAYLAAFTKIKVLAAADRVRSILGDKDLSCPRLADVPLATNRLLTTPIAAVALMYRYMRVGPNPQERMPTRVVAWRYITTVRTEIIILTARHGSEFGAIEEKSYILLAFVPNAHLNRLVASITADSIGVQRRAS